MSASTQSHCRVDVNNTAHIETNAVAKEWVTPTLVFVCIVFNEKSSVDFTLMLMLGVNGTLHILIYLPCFVYTERDTSLDPYPQGFLPDWSMTTAVLCEVPGV